MSPRRLAAGGDRGGTWQASEHDIARVATEPGPTWLSAATGGGAGPGAAATKAAAAIDGRELANSERAFGTRVESRAGLWLPAGNETTARQPRMDLSAHLC